MTDTTPAALCPGCFAEKGPRNPCPHCGYDEFAPRGALVLAHRTLLNGQFLIGRVLGKPGGFGITYLGWDLQLATRVAIKEYLPRELAGRGTDQVTVAPHTREEGDLFRHGLEQFLREARTLAQLDHPNIVRVRHFFEANGTAYLVMDYYEGLSLAEYLDQHGGRLSEATAQQLMMPILDGLRAAHAKHILHRDIKPRNLYLAWLESGGVRPILLDFGAARQAMGEHSRSLSVVLTPGYAPFEQYHRRGEQGPWTDIYAAAAVLYRLVTGETPPESTERIARDELKPASSFGVSSNLNDALTQALAVQPEARPRRVEEFQALLMPPSPELSRGAQSVQPSNEATPSASPQRDRGQSDKPTQTTALDGTQGQPSLAHLSAWTKGWLYTQAAISILAVISGWVDHQRLLSLSDTDLDLEDLWQAVLDDTAAWQFLVDLGSGLIFLITAVFILRWTYRANACARRLGAGGMTFTPGWSIGWYFIPIANLWKPYQAMAEIWRATSNPADWRTERLPPLLGWWWGVWLISSLVQYSELNMLGQAQAVGDLLTANLLGLLSDLMTVALSVMLARIIDHIQLLQDAHEHRRRERQAPISGSQPLVTYPPETDNVSKPVAARSPLLVGMSGPYANLSIPLSESPLVIGRDPSVSQLVLVDIDTISKRHALISYAAALECFFLEDLGSSNGTFVLSGSDSPGQRQAQGRRLTAGERFKLHPGDRFYLASPAILFRVTLSQS